ncbi:MAG: DUF2244 domain-containing protein [Halioglobus sp.]
MVSSTHTATRVMIIARPNQSATWNDNVWLLLALAVPVLGIALFFALLGAWLILPFAGLELLALGTALYRVSCNQQYRHIITVSADSVRIDKGRRASEQHWDLVRHNAGLTITAQDHPWDGPQLCVHDSNSCVTLGEFLNREDSLKLLALLQREIRVRAHSASAVRNF